MTPPHDLRLLPAALAAYAAALAIVLLGASPVALAGAASALAVTVAAARPRAAGAWLALLAAAVVAVAGGSAVARAHPIALAAMSDGAVDVTFAGRVERDPQPVSGGGEQRWRVVVAVDAIDSAVDEADGAPGEPRAAGVRALVIVVGAGEWGDVRAGDSVRARGPLVAEHGAREAAVAWGPQLLESRTATGWRGAVRGAREGLRNAAAPLPPEVRGLVIGMSIGDTSQMPAGQVADFRTTSLAHLTAVSGAHVAILLAAVALLARGAAWGRARRAGAAALAVAGLVALVLPDPSVVRAAWMGAVVVLGLAWGRPAAAMPALSTGVVGLLVWDPYLARSFGFALSVAATAGIAMWAPVLAARLSRVVAPALARVAAVPLAAQVSCFPILVALRPGVSAYGILANGLAVPFVLVVTLSGVGAAACAPLAPAAAAWLASVAGLAARPIAWIARTLAGAPGAWIPWPEGAPGVMLAAVCSGCVIAATAVRRVRGWTRIAAASGIIAVALASPAVRAAWPDAGRDAPPDWRVAVCDVGQGDAIALRTAERSAVLVDVGPRDGDLVGCLARLGIRTLTAIVITHPHADHDGALRDVLERFEVGRAWVGPHNAEDRATLQSHGVDAVLPQPGTVVRSGMLTVAAWHRGENLGPPATSSDVNDDSVALWGASGGVTYLLLGDLELDGQRTFDNALPRPRAFDVVKAAHHGSARQDAGFIGSLAAAVVAVSVGAGNPYGHPSQEAVHLYGSGGAWVARTDLCGDVFIGESGVSTGRPCRDVVAGWAHGEPGSAGVGSGGARAARPRGRPGGGPRGASGRRDRRRGAREGGRCRGDAPGRNALRTRGPPRRDQPVAVRGARGGRGGGGRVDVRRVPRGRRDLRGLAGS